jgi:BirA family biotin operon repressor/biotin-[acetyl-CoA-carboxylase] ligase
MSETPHLQSHHLQWGAEALWQQLQPLLPGLSVEVVARTDSTNTQLLERARRAGAHDEDTTARTHGRRAGDAQPCLLVAEAQTRGRGRQGKPRYSSPGASLTFSLALPLAPSDWSGLSLAVGVAIADALDPPAEGIAPRLGVKWPNDVFLLEAGGGRKLGGILIETVAAGSRRLAIIGIGLNVLPLTGNDSAGGFACLQEIDPDATAPGVLARVARPLVETLRRFEREGFAGMADDFARRDLLRGREVRTTHPGVPEGTALGVAPDGSLQVRTPDGTVHAVNSGEVSVRLSPGGEASC